MKKRILFVSALILSSVGAHAQQDAALTHFMYNKFAVNPGATGINDGLCGNLIYRNQWDKVNGAPNSALFNAEANLPSMGLYKLNAGVGLNVTHDAIAFNRQTNVTLNYSHHFDLSNGGKLGIGIGLGIISFGNNPVWIPPQTLLDANLPAGSNAMTFDANAGIYYKAKNWYVGLSSTHLPAPRLSQKSSFGTGNVAYKQSRHYYAMGGYVFKSIGGSIGDLDVQGIFQSDFIKSSFNFNARYVFMSKMYGGLGFRGVEGISALLGYQFLDGGNQKGRWNAWAGYSYDFTVGQLSKLSNGTHELAVKFCYIPIIPITPSKNPRWL